jgi:heme exporter protein C
MRERIKYLLAVVSLGLALWVVYLIATTLPLEVVNVGAYQNIYFHVGSFATAFSGFFLGLGASLLYLKTGNFKYDSFAAGVNEIALLFATVGLAMGSIWGRYAWGVWWDWDARLTSMLLCWLVYAGYLMMRKSVDEPSTRARLSAVLSIFGCLLVVFVYRSIDWFRTQHPSAVFAFRGGGGLGPGMDYPIMIAWGSTLCMGILLAMVRMEQAEMSREIDALRREVHSY